MTIISRKPILRFAPSPNGELHLGHAYSALLNFKLAQKLNGTFLVRVEDIDTIRCTPDKITQCLEDLAWLGLEWEQPVLHQSTRFQAYQSAAETLKSKDLLYPSSASRKQIQTALAALEQDHPWPRDPDGAPLYPREKLSEIPLDPAQTAWRLDNKAACEQLNQTLTWQETGFGPEESAKTASLKTIQADPAQWGDTILQRKDCGTSYHLSVILDDALQGISHIVRGQDLYHATSLHRLLQDLLELPAPLYHHHELLTDAYGKKLAKSRASLSMRQLREEGHTPQDIHAQLDLNDHKIETIALSLQN